jgi:hypothetical protein
MQKMIILTPEINQVNPGKMIKPVKSPVIITMTGRVKKIE